MFLLSRIDLVQGELIIILFLGNPIPLYLIFTDQAVSRIPDHLRISSVVHISPSIINHLLDKVDWMPTMQWLCSG